jgi:hypothetical protein
MLHGEILVFCCPFLSLLPVAFTYNEIGFKHWHGIRLMQTPVR